MPEDLDRCVEKIMKDQNKTKEEAFAICKSTMENKKERETTSKNRSLPSLTLVPIIRPSLEQPKHTQDYCGFQETTPYDNQSCQGCAFYIKGDGMVDNQCQLIQATPSRILPESWCRFWKTVDSLEGTVPIIVDIDDSLPDDIKALIQDNDVVSST